MNYLAHLYLANDNEDALIGNMLGDFVKGCPAGRYNEMITAAIIFHRKVDSFTDAHPMTRASRNLFSATRRRFAGIIVDVCYDHFLARHWQRFSSESLASFARRVYGILNKNRSILPQRLKSVLSYMISQDWLGGYTDLGRVGTTLDRIAGRLTRGQQFCGALAEIEVNYLALEHNFYAFFPDLQDFSVRYQRGK